MREDTLQKIWIGLCIAYPLITLISIAATNLLLALIVLGWFFFYRRIPTSPPKPILILIVIYLVWTLIAVALSPYSSNWQNWFEERSTLLAVFPGLVIGSNYAWLRKSFRWVSVLLVFLAIYAVYQYFSGWDVLRGRALDDLLTRYHATGFQDLHLTFAGMIGLAMPVAAVLYSDKVLKSSVLVLSGAVSVTTAMARTIMLGLIGCGALFLFLGSRKLRIAGLLLIAAMIILPNGIFNASGERLKRGLKISEAPVEQQGDPTRIYLWKSALNIISHYPWLGVGEGNWLPAFECYGVAYDNYSTTAGAHNDFLNSMVENGIPGGAILIALWIAIVAYTVRSALQVKGSERDLRLGFLSAFLIILFGGIFQGYQTDAENALLLWFLVGVTMQLTSKKQLLDVVPSS